MVVLSLDGRTFYLTQCQCKGGQSGWLIREYFSGGRQVYMGRLAGKFGSYEELAQGVRRHLVLPLSATVSDGSPQLALATFPYNFYGALKNVGDFCFKSRVTASGGTGLVTATAVEAGSFIMYAGSVVQVVPPNVTYVITAMPVIGCDVIVYDFLDPIDEPSLQTYGTLFFEGEDLRAVKPMIIDGTYSTCMAILANDPTFPGSKLLDLEENAQLVAVLRRDRADGLLHVVGAALRTTRDMGANVAVGVCYSRDKE